MRRHFTVAVDTKKLEDFLRKKLITVEELARAADINTITVYAILNRKRARIKTIRKIAEVLQIDPHELVVSE